MPVTAYHGVSGSILIKAAEAWCGVPAMIQGERRVELAANESIKLTVTTKPVEVRVVGLG